MMHAHADAVGAIERIEALLQPGLIGFYEQFEVTEIVAFVPNEKVPVNVFTLMVAEEHSAQAGQGVPKAPFLCPRIELKALRGWKFGVARYRIAAAVVPGLFRTLIDKNEWLPMGTPLSVDTLVASPLLFVPPDGTTIVPLNGVLKNNFWSGSYVIDWRDEAKTSLLPLLHDPCRLQDLSKQIQAVVPIKLAALSDRLGNVVVQLPVTVLVAEMGHNADSRESYANVHWHPKASSRPVFVSTRLQHDGVMTGQLFGQMQGNTRAWPMTVDKGTQTDVLWDESNSIVLAATNASNYMQVMNLSIRAVDHEPRVFKEIGPEGGEVDTRVVVFNNTSQEIRAPNLSDEHGWGQRRIYKDEVLRLTDARQFVQYRPTQNNALDERRRAIEDVRWLINQHGQHGVYIWDPYLSAMDVLNTLFHCAFGGVNLRALTAGFKIPEEKNEVKKWRRVALWASSPAHRVREDRLTFAEEQQRIFRTCDSNFHQLQLEFRMKVGPVGWSFHDRFLIFPWPSGAQAWSLGTSVNSLGKQHHILQKVSDGQLVLDAFNELWEKLDGPDNLVWKTP